MFSCLSPEIFKPRNVFTLTISFKVFGWIEQIYDSKNDASLLSSAEGKKEYNDSEDEDD